MVRSDGELFSQWEVRANGTEKRLIKKSIILIATRERMLMESHRLHATYKNNRSKIDHFNLTLLRFNEEFSPRKKERTLIIQEDAKKTGT